MIPRCNRCFRYRHGFRQSMLYWLLDCVARAPGMNRGRGARMTVILAFTAEQVSNLTGITVRQLRYWDKTKFFSPSLRDDSRRPFGRLYSFRDVVGLRVIAEMRNERNIPLPHLRELKRWFDANIDEPWATLKFYVAGRKIRFDDPRFGVRRAGETPVQTYMDTIDLDEIRAATERDAERLRVRTPDEIGAIQRNRYVSHNYPVIAGTRIRTEAIWNFYEAGYSVDAIIRQYPRLTHPDVDAAIAFERRQRKLAS